MTCPLYILPELGVLFVGQRCRGNQEAAGAALSFVEGRDFGNSGRKKMIERSYLAAQEFYEILVVLFLRQSLCKLKLRVGDVRAFCVSLGYYMVILQLAAFVSLRNAQAALGGTF